MRYSILILVFILSAAMSFISAQKIVDEALISVVMRNCPACINKEGQLTASADTLQELNTFFVEVRSWEGFHFPRLKKLYINSYRQVPLPNKLPTSLEELHLSGRYHFPINEVLLMKLVVY